MEFDPNFISEMSPWYVAAVVGDMKAGVMRGPCSVPAGLGTGWPQSHKDTLIHPG